MRFAVIQFGGSNCDRDARHVVSEICGVDCDLVWYKDGLSRPYDAVILPGGFSYGDYLRAGAIAARTPVMNEVIAHAQTGTPGPRDLQRRPDPCRERACPGSVHHQRLPEVYLQERAPPGRDMRIRHLLPCTGKET